MDREDILYCVAVASITGGAALSSPSAGLITFGSLLLFWPFVARLFSSNTRGNKS